MRFKSYVKICALHQTFYPVDQETACYSGSYRDGEATSFIVEIEQHEVDLGPGSPELFSASASSVACLKAPDITRLLSMQTYKSQRQLMNMVDGIRLDLQNLASKPVETKSRDPPDSNVHFDALKVEARALACNINYPVMRLGFEGAMGLAFSTSSNPTEKSLRKKSVFLDNVEHSLYL
ncbi:hypothetical protein BOTCAL_0001g00380 [Botryotinia calthae]|uniref:Uncharacterized protein n=1 Tax=Botryotinia calthae TaxID=38488 RepID=A0A4Y8DKQ9_9HELO|nr:hypothetical protein BOTCAL_0001g00380 [Botryotinia calthae]